MKIVPNFFNLLKPDRDELRYISNIIYFSNQYISVFLYLHLGFKKNVSKTWSEIFKPIKVREYSNVNSSQVEPISHRAKRRECSRKRIASRCIDKRNRHWGALFNPGGTFSRLPTFTRSALNENLCNEKELFVAER